VLLIVGVDFVIYANLSIIFVCSVAFHGRLTGRTNHTRRHFTACPSSSREVDLKQMQDYAAGLSEKLKAASEGESTIKIHIFILLLSKLVSWK
jgi:hypothetical protein